MITSRIHKWQPSASSASFPARIPLGAEYRCGVPQSLKIRARGLLVCGSADLGWKGSHTQAGWSRVWGAVASKIEHLVTKRRSRCATT
ncbi:hypothetical protein IG631_00922 [Alternaria alternata]|nr:hypothetical protein IG631_00922 [Alternaria alternata]